MTFYAENPIRTAHLRIARPTDQLDPVIQFYVESLGFDEIGRFQDHEGFDGVMLGHKETGYHLEFTHCRGCNVGRSPNQEHLLVFYVPDPDQWQRVIDHIERCGNPPVALFNPYWDRMGRSYEDPDGYRVVIQCADWPQ